MSSFSKLSAVTVLFAFLTGAAVAQRNDTSSSDSSCDSDYSPEAIQRNANATGSYELPAFSTNSNQSEALPLGDWTYNTAVTVRDNEPMHNFWIETPNLKDLEPRDFLFGACAVIFSDLPRASYIDAQDDDGDCSATMGQECRNALISLAGDSITVDTSSDACTNFVQELSNDPPPECESVGDFGSSVSASEFFSKAISEQDTNGVELDWLGPNPLEARQEDSSADCPSEDDNTVQSLFSVQPSSQRSSGTFNQTQYDESIYRVIPFLSITTVVDWREGGGGGAFFPETRLICMRASNVTAGSRAPPVLRAEEPEETSSPTAPAGSSPTPDRDNAGGRKQIANFGCILALAVMMTLF
ncbi:MAG: hypothetical protein Q9174_004155 [Haloplaca sp. 1 TL-2023]